MSESETTLRQRIDALQARCEALENEKRLLERILDALDDTVFVFDPETGRPLAWNRAFREASAASDEEIGASVAPRDWYDAEELERASAALQKLATTGRTRTQLSLLSRDGRRIPTEYHATMLDGFDGARQAAVSVGRDISEPLESRTTLERNQALFDALVRHSPAPIWIGDADGTMVEINQALCDMLHVEPQAVVGRYNVFADENLDAPEKVALVRRAYEDGEAVTFLNKYTSAVLAEKTSVEEATFHVSVSAFPIKDASGEVTHVVFQHVDLTELMAAEAAQRETEKKYGALVDSIPDPLVVLDHQLNHVLINDAVSETVQKSREEVMRTNYRDMFPNHESHPFFQAVTRVLETREREMLTAPWSLEGQPERWFQLSIYPVPDGVLFLARDVSDYKAMEERLFQSQKMEAIGTLAGGVAHDFNNLMTGVQGHVSLMAMELPEEHACQEHCQGVSEIVRSATSLTQQLLGFARGGKYQLQPTDANALLRRTTAMFSRTRRQLKVHTKALDCLWTVSVDRSQLEQVILNLLVNAWQAMPTGGDLTLETRNVELDAGSVRAFDVSPGRYVQISVTDTGEGMDKDTLARVFEPFFTTRSKGRGTGLGLASSYGIVRNHGGMITADSMVGRGSTFIIYLPATDDAVAREAEPPKSSQSGTETVLVIDDEEMVRRVTARLLERLGYRVLSASSGEQGLALFEANRGEVELVMLDMILPGEDPTEILAKLRGVDADARVLLCSGYSLGGQAVTMLDLGCQGFLQKPFQLATLSEAVRKVLDSA